MSERDTNTKPEFERTPDVPKATSESRQFFASLPDNPEEHDKYERVQIGRGDTALVAWRLKPEQIPVGQEKLPHASYNDMEKGYRLKGITSKEIVATTGSQLEEMLLDLEDRRDAGESGLAAATREIKQALAFMNSDAIKPNNERSSIGKISDEIDRLRAKSEQTSHPHQEMQKKQIDQKLRGYTLALDMMNATNNAVMDEYLSETNDVSETTGKDITEPQGNIIMAHAIQSRIDRHNERIAQNAKRRADRNL